MALRICLIASEVAPLSKTGGLGDVSAALLGFLRSAGHDARMFTPLYAQIDRAAVVLSPVPGLTDIALEVGPHRFRYSLLETRLPGTDTPLYLIDCPALYARKTLYTRDADEHLRFLALTRASFECCQRLKFSPQILHCNDWHTAFGPLFLRYAYSWDQLFQGTRSVMTIHNLGYQGIFSAQSVGDLALGDNEYLLHQDDLASGEINAMKHGILYADAVTTVSPTYAQEILTDEHGMGLQMVLKQRADALIGILNGVDYRQWDPRHDPYLPKRFDARSLANKLVLKKELLERLKLTTGPRAPLAGIVSRLAMQKGFDLLFESMPRLMQSHDFAVVALGAGEEKYERFFAELVRDFPGRVHFHRGYSEELAHWIEAASDMFLMPSLYEPCGLNQMYSLRYGTVPIVRKTGGLADSVRQYDPSTRQGTGIQFQEFTAEALQQAIETAFALYREQQHWRQMVANGMKEDFSWTRQGMKYVELYERLLR